MADKTVKSRKRSKRAESSRQAQSAPLAEAQAARTEAGAGEITSDAEALDNPDQALLGETFQVEESRPTRSVAGDGHAARWRSGKKAKEQAAQSSLTLLTILDGAIGLSLGPECAMTNDEREMIQQPLARIMARMTPETSEMIDKYTDPVLLVFGFVMWGSRVFLVLQRQANEAKPKPAKPQMQTAEPPTVLPATSDMATGIPQAVAEALG